VVTKFISRAGMVAGLLIVAVALAACAEGEDISDKVPGPKTSAEVVDCLESAAQKTNFTISGSDADLDEIAKKATDRAVAVELKESRAMVVIEGSEQDIEFIADLISAVFTRGIEFGAVEVTAQEIEAGRELNSEINVVHVDLP